MTARRSGRHRPTCTLRSLCGRGAGFRQRLFAMAALTGIVVSLSATVFNAVCGSWLSAALCLALALASVALIVFAHRTNRYRLAYIITTVVVFLVTFPLLFFDGGGYESGMPLFFLFGIVFTAVMLDGVALWVLGGVECALYVACLWAAFTWPGLVRPLGSPEHVLANVIFSLLVTGTALTVIIHALLRIHRRFAALLERRNAQLQRADREREEFLSIVAHELNTPIAVVQVHAERALASMPSSHPENDPGCEALRIVLDETQRLGRLVEQLLDLGRMESGRLIVRTSLHDLGELIQSTLFRYSVLGIPHDITLQVAPNSANPRVLVDPERVSQVLVNLLSNAVRHTREGSITISVVEREGWADVTVADTGEGMPPDRLEHLFERSPSINPERLRSSRDSGLGLGLVISRHIMREHGGELTIDSVAGGGTTVTLTFPLREAAGIRRG